MASYEWIDLENGNNYDRLPNVLDPAFDPKGIAKSLESQVTDAVRGMLVEHGYVDKDYRSTFYNFYAKKGHHYRTDCVRLHFFDGAVWYDEARTDIACADGRPQDHYFGYIVLRPTIVATLGRSVLSPNIIYYPADAIEALSRRVGRQVERRLANSKASDDEPRHLLRRYFITTVSKLREYARSSHTHLGDTLVGLIMHLETAQFVWVVEYCSVAQWNAGRVAARAIVDATASPTDPVPIWLLHDEDIAHVFDRSSAEWKVDSICLDREGLGPLPRIELNLRPVVESPASLKPDADASQPGGQA